MLFRVTFLMFKNLRENGKIPFCVRCKKISETKLLFLHLHSFTDLAQSGKEAGDD